MAIESTEQIGKIVQLNKAGVGFLVGVDEKNYAFTFDKILRRGNAGYVRYRGESAASMGLHEGMDVEFVEVGGLVDSLKIR